MGGASGGEIASKLAVEKAKNIFLNNFKEIEKRQRKYNSTCCK